jgi:anti-anti-sigma factor
MIEPASVTLLVDEDGSRGVMFVAGEMDVACERDVLAKAASLLQIDTIRRLVIDLAKVTFMDSSGIGALIKLYRMTAGSGRSATLRNPSRAAAAVLYITAVDQLFAQ